jgi:hypothetical protein
MASMVWMYMLHCVQVVVQRLEAEAAAARSAAQEEVARKEAGVAARHAAALKEAKRELAK